MNRTALIIIYFLILAPFPSQGQEILSHDQFMEWVRNYHPVARQADITLRFGQQEMRIARGGFDPLLYGDYDQKQFNNTRYYDKREAGIVIPTVAGVEFKGLFEQNSGQYLNDERTVPPEGLIVAGLSFNIGQGLFIDGRRAALRQAEIYRESTFAEREQILNDLYLQANQSYWNWSAAYENRKVLEEGVRLSEIRFEGIKGSYELGDLPAIDTVEAFTQILNRQFRLQTAEISYFDTGQEINTFLWGDDSMPINLNSDMVPEPVSTEIEFQNGFENLRTLIPDHPELRLADFDLASLEVERRWKAEQIKPIVKVNYNLLATSLGQLEQTPFFENNYKWGFTISTPLFLRRERGELGLTKARLDYKQNDRDLKLMRLEAKLESAINNFQTIQTQFGIFSANILGLERLLQGEMTRFEIGESSLFLINAREVAVLEARLTLNELLARRKIAHVRMLNAAGLGFLDLVN